MLQTYVVKGSTVTDGGQSSLYGSIPANQQEGKSLKVPTYKCRTNDENA